MVADGPEAGRRGYRPALRRLQLPDPGVAGGARILRSGRERAVRGRRAPRAGWRPPHQHLGRTALGRPPAWLRFPRRGDPPAARRVWRAAGGGLRGCGGGERRRPDRGLHAAHAGSLAGGGSLDHDAAMTPRPVVDPLDRLDREHLIHGFGSPAVAASEGSVRLVRGKGVYVWDDRGRRYLDGLASLWNVAVGHGRGEIARAVAAQIRALEFAATRLGFSSEPAIRLGARIARMAP